MRMRKEAKRDRINIGVGTSITVKVGDINEKLSEGKSRIMRKDLAHLDD